MQSATAGLSEAGRALLCIRAGLPVLHTVRQEHVKTAKPNQAVLRIAFHSICGIIEQVRCAFSSHGI
jgi:hypothetical protein